MILNKQDLNTQALKNLLACLLFLASPALAEKKLLVMATTDLHGQIAPLNSTSLAGQTVGIGGISILSSYIKALRKSRTGAQILVDAGDLFQGTMESNTLEGSPIVELYNYLRVDATAIGNHEFDFGPQGPDRVQVQSTQDPLGALRLRMKEAHFPFLSVNIIDRLTGRPLPDIAPSKVIEKEGVTIGIIGATTQHTPESTIAANVAHLKFVDPIPLIKSEALRLKKEGVDFIVITYHEGEKCKDHSLEALDDVKTCSTESILPLIDQMPKGLIDVIVAGHTHRDLIKRYKGVVILQSGARGQYLTWAELSKKDSTPFASSQVSKTEICELAQEDKNGEFVCQSWSVRKNDRPFTARTFKGVVIVPDEWVETHIVHPNVSRVVALKSRKTKVVVDGNMDRRYSGESP